MNKYNRTKIRWNLAFLAVIILFFTYFTMAHESAHSIICTDFGGKVTYSGWDWSRWTFVTNCQPPAKDEFLLLANANVENFGYQIEVLMYAILACVFVLGYLLIWLAEIKDRKNVEGKRLRGDE